MGGGEKSRWLSLDGETAIVRRDCWIQGGILFILKEKIEILIASSHRWEEVEDLGEKMSNPFREVHRRTEQTGPELRWNSPSMTGRATSSTAAGEG